MALSVKEIEHAHPGEKPRKLYDGKGLYLLVATSGSRRWYLKYSFAGGEKNLALGAYPEVSLKTARNKRDEARATLADGRDPSRERQKAKLVAKAEAANTFGAIGREYLAKQAADGLAEVTLSKSEWLLSKLEPALGRVPIVDISAPMLLGVLESVAQSGRRETAKRLRSLAGRIFKHAVNTGRAQNNPAESLKRVLATPTVRSHPAIVDPCELGALLRAIETYEGYPSTTAALRLSPHLFQRPGEIRTMRWVDVDLEGALWSIPAETMKMRRSHEVPLSRQAIAIIREMQLVSGHSEFVFPAFHTPKRPISENTINQALRRLGFGGVMTAHGFRSTASSLLNESELWHPDVIERALAHQDTNAVRRIYNRSTYRVKRTEMFQWWSDHLDALRADPTA